MNQKEQNQKVGLLIAKCWSDESFKQELLADPTATLQAEGVALPAGLSLVALENTDKVFHLVIPAKPSELSDEDLDMVAGGKDEKEIKEMMKKIFCEGVGGCKNCSIESTLT